MISQVNDLLVDALIYVGAYAQGETPNPEDMSLALRVMNRKIDSLAAEKLSMIGIERESYPLTGVIEYNYGPNLTWNAQERPIKIKSASTQALNGTEMPAKIATAEQWAAVADKSRTGIFVETMFYNNGYPTGLISVSPIPNSGQMVLYTFQQIVMIPAPTGTVDLAPGFTEVFVTMAAQELCIAFQRPLTEELKFAADQSKSVIVQLCAELFDAPAPAPEGPGPTAPPASRIT